MKKVILLFFLALSQLAYSQKIEFDKVEGDKRYIFCSHQSIRDFKDQTVLYVALYASQYKDQTFYDLSIKAVQQTEITIPKGSELLIKLMDDSIITLTTPMDYSDKIGEVKNVGGYVFTQYTVTPTYSITPEQIELICKGVKKIRIKNLLEPIDKEFKKDKIGKIITKEYKLLQEALAKTSPNDDSNF